MEKIYYPDHDKRYAHIPERERWKYPDAVRIGASAPIERRKPYAELTWDDVPEGIHPCLVACDVPFLKGCLGQGGWS